MKTYFLAFFLLVIPVSVWAEACTSQDSYTAETVVDYLNNWHNLNLAYKQFKGCDSAAIGEGFSEAVARLLVDQWSNLNEFVLLSSKDAAFKKFVLFHIDGTLNIKDLQKIKGFAETNCPKDAKNLCIDIAREAGEAIKKP